MTCSYSTKKISVNLFKNHSGFSIKIYSKCIMGFSIKVNSKIKRVFH